MFGLLRVKIILHLYENSRFFNIQDSGNGTADGMYEISTGLSRVEDLGVVETFDGSRFVNDSNICRFHRIKLVINNNYTILYLSKFRQVSKFTLQQFSEAYRNIVQSYILMQIKWNFHLVFICFPLSFSGI